MTGLEPRTCIRANSFVLAQVWVAALVLAVGIVACTEPERGISREC
jgi:hypothetical protein